MILGYRAVRQKHFHGFNLLVFHEWLLPIENLGQMAFAKFDESSLRLKSDPDATKHGVEGFEDQMELSYFHTASLAAQRALPDRYRSALDFYTVALSSSEPSAWVKLPAWAHLSVETVDGQLGHWKLPNKEWTKISLTPDDRFLHMSLWKPEPVISLAQPSDKTSFFRISSFFEVAAQPFLGSSLELSILKKDLPISAIANPV